MGGLVNPVIYDVIRRLLSVGTGVKMETLGNIVYGVTDAIANEGLDITDAMFILNTPASQRKKVAENVYGKLDINEFA